MKSLIVSTTIKINPQITVAALKVADRLQVNFLPRENKSLAQIEKEQQVEYVLIVGRDKLSVWHEGAEYFFHPNMARIRIKNIISGHADQMATAMDLAPGDSVLDCTLGLGSDALVSSFMVGESGQVVGLEKVSLIALITDLGLKNYADKHSQISAAMRRIEVKNIDYKTYLHSLPDNFFDCIYFDPMFRWPRMKSSALNSLRQLADPAPLNQDIIKEAKRVAVKRVIMKETKESTEFARLGFNQKVGGKYSPVAYGVIEI